MGTADDLADSLIAELVAFIAQVPLLQPVERTSVAERHLWRACELCTYLEYRFTGAPDPRSLRDDALREWTARGLASGEAPGDPNDLLGYRPYWVAISGRRLGTVAVTVRSLGWGEPSLWVASLYLFREERRGGNGTLIMAVLEGIARHLGLGGIRLETQWLWQGAVRFYLRHGFWVANWNRGLSLVRPFDRAWAGRKTKYPHGAERH